MATLQDFVCRGTFGLDNETAGGVDALQPSLWHTLLAGLLGQGVQLDQLQQLALDLSLALLQANATAGGLNASALDPAPACAPLLAAGQLPLGDSVYGGNQTQLRQAVKCGCQLASAQSVRSGWATLAETALDYAAGAGLLSNLTNATDTAALAAWAVQLFEQNANITLTPADTSALTALATVLMQMAPAINATYSYADLRPGLRGVLG
jgi:hypothetical protein